MGINTALFSQDISLTWDASTADEKGTVTQGGKEAEGGATTAENTEGVSNTGSVEKFTSEGIKVRFSNAPNSKYAFEQPTRALSAAYKKLSGSYLPFKAIENQQEEPFLAQVEVSDTSVNLDSLVFKTSKGVAIPSKRISGTTDFELTLKGRFDFATEEVQAVIKQGKKYKVAGAFYLIHLSPRTVKLNLVPTEEGMNLSARIAELQAIYKKVAVDVEVTIQPVFSIASYLENGKLPSSDAFGDLSTYSEAERAIIHSYKSENEVGLEYYIFVTNVASSSGQSGYMRLNGQFGFVFEGGSARTIAHELGHGAFRLEHPFKQFRGLEKGDTDNLMDYSGGTAFSYPHWQQINDPKLKLYAFQGQDEGEYSLYAHMGLTPDGDVFDEYYLNNSKIKTTIIVEPTNYTIGKLKYKGKKYLWDTKQKGFVGSEGTIKIKKVKKVSGKVNIYRSRNDGGCSYDYLTISWGDTDRKAGNIVAQIEKHIANYKNNDWKYAPYNVRDESCGKKFFTELLGRDRELCNKEEIAEGQRNLRKLLGRTDAKTVIYEVNNYCLAAIRGLQYTEIQKLINIIISDNKELKEDGEVALLRLMTGIQTKDYAAFYKYLEQDNNRVIKYLIREVDDASLYFWTDKNNYTNFIGALVWMYNKYPKTIENRWPSEKDTDVFATRIINLEPIKYSSDMDDIFPKFTEKVNKGEYNEAGKIALYDVYNTYKPNSFNGQLAKSSKKEHITDVSLLTPLVIIPNKNPLPLVATALEENGTNNHFYVVPAVFLKYNSDKIRNHNIEKGITTTLDIITIASSGGTALATKVHWIRRAWAMAEVVGAVGNIAVNTENITDPNIKAVVDAYNMAMGVIGLKNLGKGGYQFVKNLPDKTKKLLQENKGVRSVLTSEYLKWKTLTKKLDNLNDTEKQLIAKQEKVWKSLGIADKLGNGVDEFLEGFVGVVRKGSADEIADATNRIANHRTAINKPSSGNFGYVEGSINGNSVDNKLWSSGPADPITEPQIFDATEVGGWVRNTDSEYKMLNKLADDLGGVKGNTYPNITGEIKVVSERTYCTSCQGVLQQFSEMFPNLKLILIDGVR